MVKVLSKLTDSQREELKKGIIEVSGKAMNRTALGIVDAVLKLYPSVTMSELKEILPDSINPSAPKNYRSLFKPYSDRPYGVVQPGSIRQECQAQGLEISNSHFVEDGEVFKLQDGTEVLVSRTWESSDSETGQHDLQNLINHVQQYGVKVVEFEKNKPFTKGGYSLEVINPAFLAAMHAPKASSKWWIIVLVVLLLLGIGAFFFLSQQKATPAPAPTPQVVDSVPVDTPQVDELSKLKEDIKAGVNTENRSITFSDIHFTKGKADLLPQSDSALAEALGLMRDVPELKVEIIGHTSEEGSESFNRKLSQKRAEAVMKYLENQGIDALRMKATGKGFDEPLAPNDTEENRSKNRRTEFKVTDDGVKDS